MELLRAVGAMGGFTRWAQFFEKHQEIRQKLMEFGAMPDNLISVQDVMVTKTTLSKGKKIHGPDKL